MQEALSDANAAVSTSPGYQQEGARVSGLEKKESRSRDSEETHQYRMFLSREEQGWERRERALQKNTNYTGYPGIRKWYFSSSWMRKVRKKRVLCFFCFFCFLMGCHFLGKTVDSKLGGSFVSIPCAHWGRNGVYGKSKMEPINTFPRKFFKDWESINFLWKSKISIYILHRRKP